MVVSPILDDRCDYSRSIHTATRLSSLMAIISPEDATEETIEKITTLSRKIKELQTQFAQSLSRDRKELLSRELTILLSGSEFPDLSELYKTVSCPEKLAKRVLKDLECIRTGIPPISKSAHGNTGVFFIEYKNKDFIIKWASILEQNSQQIYKKMLLILNDPTLKMPDSKMINKTSLPECIVNIEDIDRSTSIDQLLVFAKAPGAPLSDFVQKNYNSLTEKQKEFLIFKLGKIAMFDFILSNDERLIEPVLENLLIHVNPQEEPVITLIDHTIHPTNPRRVSEIRDCLTDLQNFVSKTTQQISRIASGYGTSPETEANVLAFCKDLNEKRAVFAGGCAEVLKTLKTKKEEIAELAAFTKTLNQPDLDYTILTESLRIFENL